MEQTIWYTSTIVLSDVSVVFGSFDASSEISGVLSSPFVLGFLLFLLSLGLVEAFARLLKQLVIS